MSLWITLSLAIIGFAANSILCRLALHENLLDPAIFSAIRIVSGALLLWIFIIVNQSPVPRQKINWLAAASLFVYVVSFTYAYSKLAVNVGAFILFAVVQVIFVGWGLSQGQRFTTLGLVGYTAAVTGLCYLLFSSEAEASYDGAYLMVLAGAAWCAYSIIGRKTNEPLAMSANNFLACVPFALVLGFANGGNGIITTSGVILAVVSGAYASGVAYVLWYRVLPKLNALQLASAQLAVPILATIGGSLLLAETITTRVAVAAIVVVSGLFLVWRFARPAVSNSTDVP
jgi:drug/metabolite transporter (DMT)-like permease